MLQFLQHRLTTYLSRNFSPAWTRNIQLWWTDIYEMSWGKKKSYIFHQGIWLSTFGTFLFLRSHISWKRRRRRWETKDREKEKRNGKRMVTERHFIAVQEKGMELPDFRCISRLLKLGTISSFISQMHLPKWCRSEGNSTLVTFLLSREPVRHKYNHVELSVHVQVSLSSIGPRTFLKQRKNQLRL